MTRFAKRGLTHAHAVSRHTFHRHLLAASMHQQDICLLLLKVEQSAFTQAFSQACLASTSARVVFEWPHLPLASRQPAENHPRRDWLMSLTIDLAASCDMWR